MSKSTAYLQETYFFDFSSVAIQSYIHCYKKGKISKKEIAIDLYHRVRDGWRYDPYDLSFEKESYKSSTIIQKSKGHCIEKSILLISCFRGLEIPARLRLSKVKNHIAVERLTEKFGTNVLTPHGSVDVCIDNKWIKLSPAFNASMCKISKVPPLDFDGENDAMLQKFNDRGDKFMEYIEDYGYFKDVPLSFMIQNVKDHYPSIFDKDDNITSFKL